MHTTKQKKYTLQTKLQHAANKKETVKKIAHCKQKNYTLQTANKLKAKVLLAQYLVCVFLVVHSFYGKRFTRVNNNKIKHKIK